MKTPVKLEVISLGGNWMVIIPARAQLCPLWRWHATRLTTQSGLAGALLPTCYRAELDSTHSQ